MGFSIAIWHSCKEHGYKIKCSFWDLIQEHLQGRMSVLDTAWVLQLWLLHSKTQADMGCSYLSLDLAGILPWDTARPGQSLQDSSGPMR